MEIPALLWIEKYRLGVQYGWFALLGAALLLSAGALSRSRGTMPRAVARGFWVAAMAGFVVMWGAGTALEMMRRVADLPARELVIALAAFSVFLTAVLALMRAWFGPTGNEPLRSDRVALSLLILTLTGWWIGGLALEWNALWNLAPQEMGRHRAPDGWALALGGATLGGAAHLVQSRDEDRIRVKNPRAATWWILGLALILSLPWVGANGPAASVFLTGAGFFLAKIWRARRDCPLFLRVNWGTRAVMILLAAALPLVAWRHDGAVWAVRVARSGASPFDYAMFSIGVVAVCGLFVTMRAPLRHTMAQQFSRRALLSGAVAGSVAALVLFGPAGAIFWAFWPLFALFFDLLAPREPLSDSSTVEFVVASSGADSVSA
ncbi:MAG: hypothetical protein KY445_08650 [Armatimonadetes bacterium]|nr:hypothetical protein [Armatimonadota bacterium]